MNRSVILILACLLIAPAVMAEDYIDLVKQGNEAYKKNQFSEALDYYHSAETDLPGSPELEYNMAGALFHQGKFEETVDKYTKALNSTDVNFAAKAHYNLGNTQFRMGEYESAIKSYQDALNIDPTDVDAKFNLELARRRLKEQIKPEQEDQQQQQDPQKQDEEQQQPQQNQNQQQDQQQGQQQQDQQEQQDQENQQDQNQQQMQPDDTEMSREDAERILNALRDDEQELQKQIRRNVSSSDYTGKDW